MPLKELKSLIQETRLRTVLTANAAMIQFYWDMGQRIRARQAREGWGAKVIDRLSADLREAFPDMSGLSSRNLRYMRDFAEAWPEPEIWQQLLPKLPWGQNLLERGFTSAGPHTDDLDVELAGRSARSFASQGQQRAMVLALKIGEIENLGEAAGLAPMLLLDDVSSELDPARNAFLMEYLRACGLQVFLTTTDERLVREAAGPDSVSFAVEKGVFRAREMAGLG